MSDLTLDLEFHPSLPLQEFGSRTVPDLIDRSRLFGSDRLILSTSRLTLEKMTYDVFLKRVAGAAVVLSERFRPGTRVACLVGNSASYLILRYALSCAGLVEVAVNGRHKGSVLKHMLTISNPAAVFVANEFTSNLYHCGYDLSECEIIEESGLLKLTRAIEPWSRRPEVEINPTHASRILFTSGTSGASKAVEISHAYEVYVGERHAKLLNLDVRDSWLYVTPMHHIDAIYIFSTLLHSGGCFALARDFSASSFWRDVETTNATYLCYVGSILPILLKGDGPASCHSLQWVVGGGSTAEQISQFEKRFGVTVIEAFAMTECIACTINPINQRCRGSVGRPVPGFDVRIVESDGEECPVGAQGEIVVRAAEPCGMFSRYYNDPEATAKAVRDGWFFTGDVGKMDIDGNFYYLGRRKDAIRVRGENVSAMELEAVAEAYPGVASAAAVAVPTEFGEDDILLYVKVASGQSVDAGALFDFLDHRVAPFMVPRYIRFIDVFPVTSTEKISKSALPHHIDASCIKRVDAKII